MVTPSAQSPPGPGARAPAGLGIRLSDVTCATFRERLEPLHSGNMQVARETLEAYGRAGDFSSRLRQRGNSFIAMGEALLRQAGGPPPEVDAVLLAYQMPDLPSPDVAGCYFVQRFAGCPVPLSIDEQGPGATFTALRVADAMFALGDLRRAALLAYDQNAPVWEASAAVQSLPDSAVLLLLGAGGQVRVEEIAEHQTTDPAAVLADALRRHPRARALVGTALLDQPGVTAGPGRGAAWRERVIPPPREHLFTSAWVSLARLWPLTGPVLVADFHAYTSRLYSCLLAPEEPR
jgi:hypothetical protein